MKVPFFNSIRVLVVGDVMLDRYWSGTTSRISPEAPVPVVHVRSMEERPGGAANVALNIVALGGQVDLLSFCGEDDAAESLEQQLTQAGVRHCLHRTPQLSTPTKLRVLSLHQQLIRLDFEGSVGYQLDYVRLKELFEERLPHVQAVILSDYNKGCLAQVQELIQCARLANKPIFVDPKRNDFEIYRGATVLTPNRREFEAVVGPCTNEAAFLHAGLELLKKYALQALLVTRGEEGMMLICKNQPAVYFPALAKQVYDVTGAGDTAIACFALSYVATQEDAVQATQLANIAASVGVEKLGTATVTASELRRAIQIQQPSPQRGILSETELKLIVEDARAHAEKIVMTGGCFDILHAGHVAYLTQAKRLGDRLIVAVNDDASVSLLKGSGRPINSLERRMAVLAGLSAVDWIVPFSDLTPERLIKLLLPDVWVKGGDYQLEDLPEATTVKAYGGQVKLIEKVEDCSSSCIISAIIGGCS